jgi:hypothetical protein
MNTQLGMEREKEREGETEEEMVTPTIEQLTILDEKVFVQSPSFSYCLSLCCVPAHHILFHCVVFQLLIFAFTVLCSSSSCSLSLCCSVLPCHFL